MEECSHDVEDGPKGSSFRWTDDLAKIMIELCIAYQMRNGKKQLFKWEDMATEFAEVVGMKCTKVILKNKFESLKREYKAWRLLRTADAGRWDPITRRINADEDWWDKKTREDKNCKRFRNKGMDVKLEDLWTRLYSGTVVTPSMSPYDDDDGGASTDPQGNEGPTGIDQNTIRTEDLPRLVTPEPLQQHPQQPCSSNTRASKRVKRKAACSSELEDHLVRQWAKKDKTMTIFEEQATSTGNPRTELQEGLVVIANMVKAGMLEETSPLWCYAVSLNKRKNHRATMLNLSSDANRLAYLKWEFARDVNVAKG